MKCLITGGAGFIGCNFVRHMLKEHPSDKIVVLDKGTDVESVSLLLGHSSTRTTESHYCRRREDTAIKEVLELFDPEKSRIAEKPLIEREKYLSGYA